jgi:prephenate dehydrogenase
MEIPFQRIAIIGLGLIGGSWGLALRQQSWGGVRIGCDRPDIINSALAAGVIDEATEDPLLAVHRADLIVLAAPVGAILDLLSIFKHALSPGALITDVGSTKVEICRRARETFGVETLFLGGHPLAGKERSGLANADAKLFKNATYALVPQENANLEDGRVKAFTRLVASFGARPLIIDASLHDHAVAYLSHLPQLVSTALAGLIVEQQSQTSLSLELAAAGLRDMTRLADSSYLVWRDICRTNRANIQEALDKFIERIAALRERLADERLQADFARAARLGEELRAKDSLRNPHAGGARVPKPDRGPDCNRDS